MRNPPAAHSRCPASAQEFTGFATSSPILLAALLAAILAAPGCSSSRLVGTVSRERYESPLHTFTIAIPPDSLLQDGISQDRTGGRVSMAHSTGALTAVDYQQMSATVESAVVNQAVREQIYEDFLHAALRALFLKVSPDSRLLQERSVGSGDAAARFAIVFIPHGSVLIATKAGKTERLDSMRALLVFHRGRFLYLIESEMKSAGSTLDPATLTPEIEERAQRGLRSIQAGMEFMP